MNYSLFHSCTQQAPFIVDFSKYRTYTCGKITFRGFPDIPVAFLTYTVVMNIS